MKMGLFHTLTKISMLVAAPGMRIHLHSVAPTQYREKFLARKRNTLILIIPSTKKKCSLIFSVVTVYEDESSSCLLLTVYVIPFSVWVYVGIILK
jgi:hypothetical protein